MPKISIIVPTYKTAKYLPKCLDSILNQTFQDFEIIIVSDSDEDSKVADKYASKDNRIIVLKDIKKGLGGARNAGLDIARGEYISFVDSDDWLEPQTYEKTIQHFYNDIDYVVFGVKVTGEKDSINSSTIDYMSLKYSQDTRLTYEVILNTNVSAWNKIWKKNIIDEFNIRFPEKMQYEDFPFYFQYCFVSQKAYYIKEEFYNYLQRKDSGMAITINESKFDYIKDHILGCKFLYDELCRKNLFNQNSYIFSKIFSKWLRTGLEYCNKKDKIKYLKTAGLYFEKIHIKAFDILYLNLLRKKRYKDIVQNLSNESNYYLFGILPLIKIKRYYKKSKIYLLGILIIKRRDII